MHDEVPRQGKEKQEILHTTVPTISPPFAFTSPLPALQCSIKFRLRVRVIFLAAVHLRECHNLLV